MNTCSCFRIDASNTVANKGCSLQLCETTSRFAFNDHRAYGRIWTDTLEVKEKGGMSCYSMTMHQCRSVKSSMFGEPLSPVPGKQLVRWHLMCADGGSVESYTRRMYKQKYRHAVLDFIVDLNCFHHENSNGQKASLKIADRICASFWSLPASTGYFSSLGKLANVLRMSYWKVRNAWAKQFPQDKNKLRDNLMTSVCPKPLAI